MPEKKLFRFHRGSLASSLMTKVEFEDRSHLAKLIQEQIQYPVTAEDLEIRHYGYDDRIDWEAHIVLLKGEHAGVIGFTNCAVPS